MKLIAIGDIHGRDVWKRIVEQPADKYVFVGDYFDTKDNIPATLQLYNFLEILSFKRENEGKVVMLTGNHDYHYLPGVREQYSGYQPFHRFDFQQALFEANDDMQMVYQFENLLFSHAGVTKTWLGDRKVEDINDVFKYQPKYFGFSGYDPYGDDTTQSPIWVRPNALQSDAVDGYIQVVGHTQQHRLQITEDLILIDCLGTSEEYLVWEDHIVRAESLHLTV